MTGRTQLLLDIVLAIAIGIGLALALDYWVFFDPGPIEPDFAERTLAMTKTKTKAAPWVCQSREQTAEAIRALGGKDWS